MALIAASIPPVILSSFSFSSLGKSFASGLWRISLIVLTMLSPSLRSSMRSRITLSRSLLASASRIIFWISSSDKLPLSLIVILFSFWVVKSLAFTFKIPLASKLKVISIWGLPLGAGWMPPKLKRPKDLLSRAIGRSPWQTTTSTDSWLSCAVEKIWLLLTGMVVLRLINGVATPPRVSIESVKGVTSNSNTSFTSPRNTPPWMAAPMATTSSGLIERFGLCPGTIDSTSFCTAGIRVDPPTNKISLISSGLILASRKTSEIGLRVRSSNCLVISSNLARVSLSSTFTGPFSVTVKNGKEIIASSWAESSILARSAASFKRCIAILSLDKLSPLCSWAMCAKMNSIILLSQSSPPKRLSPAVANTSKVPSAMSSKETSKVPPPRSYTKTFISRLDLSIP